MRLCIWILACLGALPVATGGGTYSQRVAVVTNTPGLVAFWDFVTREAKSQRFVTHVPIGATNDFALDAGNYIAQFWGEGREATYADFPLLGRGPFGQAIRILNERDDSFRPFLFVPRSRLHNSPIDIKGAGKSVTLVVWAVRESGNHALAGIWHEGTDLKQPSTATIKRAVRGQRQYGLFAGLNKEGAACGHVSENGAGSFNYKYAMHKSNTQDRTPTVRVDAAPEELDRAWECFAMTFDHRRDELTSWLRGRASECWQADPKKFLPAVYNAWLQGQLRATPGHQAGEDDAFPQDQFYNPPEHEPLSVEVLSEEGHERIELHEFRYTRIKVTLRRSNGGTWSVAGRDLAEIRLNPWWFPHDLYRPPDAESGGPFTIGRVIHSSRSVGFTGWIGGVAVFDRALTAEEIERLSAIAKAEPLPTPTN
jgi:hypothetical protein